MVLTHEIDNIDNILKRGMILRVTWYELLRRFYESLVDNKWMKCKYVMFSVTVSPTQNMPFHV